MTLRPRRRWPARPLRSGLALTALLLGPTACGDGEPGLIEWLLREDPEPVRIVSFVATPATFVFSLPNVLAWRVRDADRCRIDPLVGEVDPREGTAEVVVDRPTVFVLRCEDREGTEDDDGDGIADEIFSADEAELIIASVRGPARRSGGDGPGLC